ncbi:hypothetical protein [Streptomyces sp. 8N706]|uniref:hypothetical protein n=1 Tax=Streptomyces sp. 8N706 TaxID=3457416 RepID=UPI003FD18F60
MSGEERPKVGRVYTAARRHPWVLGKFGDWQIPLGPYTPAQIVIAFAGAFALIKTFSWWSWLGPIPVVGLGVAVWAARQTKFGGRSPFAAAFGWLSLAVQPRGGRINGRRARDRSGRLLAGGFVIEPAVPAAEGVLVSAGRRPQRRSAALVQTPAPGAVAPVSGMERLLLSAASGRQSTRRGL